MPLYCSKECRHTGKCTMLCLSTCDQPSEKTSVCQPLSSSELFVDSCFSDPVTQRCSFYLRFKGSIRACASANQCLNIPVHQIFQSKYLWKTNLYIYMYDVSTVQSSSLTHKIFRPRPKGISPLFESVFAKCPGNQEKGGKIGRLGCLGNGQTPNNILISRPN